ncbi:MAG: VCBS repeat-containing protein [Gammaproteobacteria bacterium]|nr:VCBS repeat-containing protein [Gammaproteobacteria bacterium]
MSGWCAASRSFSGIRAGDFDGNGRTDLIIGERHINALVIYYNTNGSTFMRKQFALNDAWIADSRVFDFNGDGRADLLKWHADEGRWYVVQSDSATFELINTGVAQRDLQLADVNGDGLQDAVVNNAGAWAIRLNRGGGFDALLPTSIPAGNNGENLNRAQVVDFNADGRDDFLAPFNGAWQRLRATPAGARLELLDPTVMPFQGYDNGPQIGDFNGDGILDMALDYGAFWHLLLHRPAHSGLITAINAGGDRFSDRITINHRPLTRAPPSTLRYIAYAFSTPRKSFDDFYTFTDADRMPSGVANTLRGLMAPIYVVESYERNNGVGGTRQYSYKYETRAWISPAAVI